MALNEFTGTLLILCSYGFFKEFMPSDPYFAIYLTGPDKNLTDTEVYEDIYPVWSYSLFATLVPVFLLTDLVRYKPMIVLQALSLIISWILLLWVDGVPCNAGDVLHLWVCRCLQQCVLHIHLC